MDVSVRSRPREELGCVGEAEVADPGVGVLGWARRHDVATGTLSDEMHEGVWHSWVDDTLMEDRNARCVKQNSPLLTVFIKSKTFLNEFRGDVLKSARVSF